MKFKYQDGQIAGKHEMKVYADPLFVFKVIIESLKGAQRNMYNRESRNFQVERTSCRHQHYFFYILSNAIFFLIGPININVTDNFVFVFIFKIFVNIL